MDFFSKGKEIATRLNRLSVSQVQPSAVHGFLSLWPQPLDGKYRNYTTLTAETTF